MKASVTEKLLRSLLSKGEPYEPIWDQIPPGIEWRIGQRKITGSIVGRVRGGGRRQPIRLLAGHYPTMDIAEIRQRGRKLRHELESGIDPRPPAASGCRRKRPNVSAVSVPSPSSSFGT